MALWRLQPIGPTDGKRGARAATHFAAAVGLVRTAPDGADYGEPVSQQLHWIGNFLLFALPLYVAFALMGFTQLFSNNLGAEGAGIQLLFLSPTPIRTVFLAKNLFHALLFFLDALLVGLLATLRLGAQPVWIVAATASWVLFALPCCLAVGNIFSLRMPFRIHPGRMTRQRGSQANALSSMALLLAVMGVGGLIFWLGRALSVPWLAVLLQLLAAAAAIGVWLRGLRAVDAIANLRREALLATLMKDDGQ